jgi:hypothetical protein
MGLLRRPTPGEIVEGGRLGRPCGPGALSRAILETSLRLRRPHVSTRGISTLTGLGFSFAAGRDCRYGQPHGEDEPTLVMPVPSPRTPPSCAPEAPHRSWQACATWSSARSATLGRQPRRRPTPPRPRPISSARASRQGLGATSQYRPARRRRSPPGSRACRPSGRSCRRSRAAVGHARPSYGDRAGQEGSGSPTLCGRWPTATGSRSG